MIRRLVIVGAGGHAKVVIDTALSCGWTIDGLTESDPQKVGLVVLDHAIIGSDDIIANLNSNDIGLALGVGTPAVRRRLFEDFAARGFALPSLVHPHARIARHVEIAAGAQIMAGAVIQPGVSIGRNAVVNTSASIDHDCTVSDHVFIAPGVTVAGGVTFGIGAFVGVGAVLLPGISVGANAIVAAGATVTADVANGDTVSGTPARSRTAQSTSGAI